MINHICYILRELAIKLFIDLPLIIVGFGVVAVALLFRLNDTRVGTPEFLLDQRLPKWARWFDNGDPLDMVYGLNGDKGYRLNKPCKTKWEIYRLRYTWLALRNPTNHFAYYILGHTCSSLNHMIVLEHISQPEGVEIGDWSHEGYRYSKVMDLDASGDIREYYFIHKWSPTRCLRIRIGFKLGQNPLDFPRKTIQRCFVIQPYKKYLGE